MGGQPWNGCLSGLWYRASSEVVLRLHSARRSQCKNWWNDDWRDRILAAIHWLSNEQGNIEIPLAEDQSLKIEADMLICKSPVTYKGSVTVELDSSIDEEEFDQDDQ